MTAFLRQISQTFAEFFARGFIEVAPFIFASSVVCMVVSLILALFHETATQ